FDNVSADPLEAEILEGAEKAKEMEADGVIGLGGGSPMDAAKAIAVLTKSAKPIGGLYGLNRVTDGRLPLMLIPTTAGTGSEATPYAVITKPTGEKISITDPASFPDIALLDPDLTMGLPPHLTAATGIDAIVHAIEAFTSKGNKSEFSDRDALKALKLLWGSVPEATKNGNNLKARADALMGAFLAGQTIANAPVGGVHALAYPLGGLHHIHHGLSNALLLPPVMRFNARAAAPLYAELADAVMPNLSGPDKARTAAFIGALEDMIEACGLETKLSQVGISESDIPKLAEEAMKLGRLLKNNPREISLEDCQRIYKSIL
ncbi:MAG: iron-containing alcohol dehydrogenase, partial [Alphaproteobacteria bacterium]